jgi:hypothetical protein
MSGTSNEAAPAGAARTDWGHVAMVLAIALFCAWYLFDAVLASASADNLLLIAPSAVLGILLALGIAWSELRRGWRHAPAEGTNATRKTRRTGVFIVLMALYVAGLAYGPFDLATFLFAVAALVALGERRWLFVLVFAAVLTVAVMACLTALLPGTLPLLLPL